MSIDITLHRALAMPMHRQLYHRVRQAIDGGQLRPGDRLPSARALAAQLNVARGTVDSAYQQLLGEGYLHSRGPAGTVVSPRLAAAPAQAPEPPALPVPLAFLHEGGPPRPLQMGLPALDAFPRKLWVRLAGRQLREGGLEALAYPPAQGDAGLRAALCRYLALARGVACQPGQVFICAGYRACLELISHTLMAPGDRCWMEEPGYFIARHALQAAGAQLVPVPVDGEGLDVAAGIARAPGARFALVTPSHQSPTGVALSLPRRQALLSWAQAQGSWVIEDDYDSEFRYQGKPLPALRSLDRHGRVLYTGTFSKVLCPGLRLAYLVVPAAQAAAFAAQAACLHNPAPLLLQRTVAAFIEQGHFARHLRTMRNLYAQRRHWLASALQALLPSLHIDLQAGGMHVLARLSEGRDTAVTEHAQALGLEPLSRWYLEAPAQQGLLMCFTNVRSAAQALECAQAVASAIAATCAATS